MELPFIVFFKKYLDILNACNELYGIVSYHIG